jgi:hypothetical protein
MRYVYEVLARIVEARLRSIDLNQHEWVAKHEQELRKIVHKYLPSGGGYDTGCEIDLDRSRENLLVIKTSFHFMNDVGYYTHWQNYILECTPSLIHGFVMKVKFANHKPVNESDLEFIGDNLYDALKMEYSPPNKKEEISHDTT